MKICKFCGTENTDSASVCSACQGNEFQLKCENCGTVFDNGLFCPKCGVKFGTKAKKCPICGTNYYTNACPNCGYTYTPNNPQIVNRTGNVQPAKKRRTWLWVLGWIFIFPIPLTILVHRSQKLNTFLKIIIIALAWIFYLAFTMSDTSETSTTDQSTESSTETITETTDYGTDEDDIADSESIQFSESVES